MKTKWMVLAGKNMPPLKLVYDDANQYFDLWREQEYLDARLFDKALLAKWEMVSHLQLQGD